LKGDRSETYRLKGDRSGTNLLKGERSEANRLKGERSEVKRFELALDFFTSSTTQCFSPASMLDRFCSERSDAMLAIDDGDAVMWRPGV